MAGVAGVLAFVMVKGIVSRPQLEKKVEVKVNSTEVLVARTDIGLGQVANEAAFRWQTWPADAVTPSLITKSSGPRAMTDLSGAIARAPILAGEPITTLKLIKAGQGGILAAILPAGMRAVSTKIKEETAVGKLILPNDHVDVLLTRTMRSRGADEHVTDTLFHNVRVLAIGQTLETKEGKKTADGSSNTATLELTPHQSEMLAQANAQGEISLALRSISDSNPEGGPTANEDINKKNTGSSIRMLRYGVKSRAYGTN